MLTSRLHSIPRFALPYTPADFAASARAIFHGGPPPEAFGLLGNSPKYWTCSGRQALRLLLEALDLKPGSGVALPLFTDPSLVGAIVAAGHRPIFIDVDPQYLTIDPKSLDAAQGTFAAVVVVHLFGQMADLPALRAAAGDVPVIEDAAHAPLSYLDGRMAGGFGAASFYSFASTKYWPAGGGGLAVVNDAALVHKVAAATQSLRRPSRVQELRKLILQSAKAAIFTRGLYGILGKPMRRWVEDWAISSLAWIRTRSSNHSRGGIPPGAAASSEGGPGSEPTACSFCRGSAPWRRSFFPSNGPEPVTTTICSRCCSGTAASARR